MSQLSDTRGTFTFGQRLGLTFIVQVACISAIMVGTLLVLIGVKAIRQWRRGTIQRPSSIHLYFISLLLADLIQALGAIFDIRWVHFAGVQEGKFCTGQAVLKQIGDTGVALSTLAIAVQTFGIIVLRWQASHRSRVAEVVIALIWTFLALITGVGYAVHRTGDEPYYGNTKWWCWIRNPPYLSLGIGLEYGWMWLTALSSFFLYAGGAIVLIYRERRDAALNGYEREKLQGQEQGEESRNIGFKMMLYPVIYTLTVAPISIVRFIQFQHENKPPPFAATAASAVILASSGLLNVSLFAWTRPAILPINEVDEERSDSRSAKDHETGSFGRPSHDLASPIAYQQPGRNSTHMSYDNGL